MGFRETAGRRLTPMEMETALRAIAAERYHNLHPYHRRMVEGALSKSELQAWALNRYCYQAIIPRKDAMIVARAEDPAFRAAWRRRIEDHDGASGWDGGLGRWLHLATALGLDPEAVKSERYALPATRFATGAYLTFCTNRTLLECVASSLTELFSPAIIAERVPAMLAKYDFVTEDTLSYFTDRPAQASRDAKFALDYVLAHADSLERQQAALDALTFKCDLLWSMLDALACAYGEAGEVPPGAFRPTAR